MTGIYHYLHRSFMVTTGLENRLSNGDMYKEHQKFLDDISGYDFEIGGCTLQQHELWLKSLTCKVIKLDGANALKENLYKIIEAYNSR